MKLGKYLLVLLIGLMVNTSVKAQFLMDMIDTTTNLGKGMFSMYKKFDALRLSGYIQPQFQYASSKGEQGYAGGNFPNEVDNRFMLRRGRLRVDYARYDKEGMPIVSFAFQFDGTERGVNIRDFYGRFFENKYNVLSISAGMFARPVGYEVNLSSGDRETPERGRMSQILMRTERDLGVMATFEPRKPSHPLYGFKLDVGAFNGQGLTGPADFDSHKDIGARAAVKPFVMGARKKMIFSAGISTWYGGMEQFTNNIYRMSTSSTGSPVFVVSSDSTNIGKIAPRHYYGADAQLKIKNKKGFTEFRAEYLRGTQTATANTTETPGIIPIDASGKYAPLYIRNFDGAYIYFLQHLGNTTDQVVLRYDWYDPNKKVKGKEVGAAGSNTTAADVRYDTFGFGYVHYFNEHFKFTLYYDLVRNEGTSLLGVQEDLKDNVLTARLQFRF
ncbi:phosphate-selective porin [Chitinophaga skermanii]|uniref:Phosphate-selective porin n=1 Tax=Chitinophaga skermanii TaxID=331697 RepID=A0A327QHW6_9BACT|nr:porin [Chitinophaga skermanii]RAJ04149.1 phosphate-selective porin [Chitinophaga skermanii]